MDIVELISNVGFPIASWLLIYIDLRKIIVQNNKLIEEFLRKK